MAKVKNAFVPSFKANMTRKGHQLVSAIETPYVKKSTGQTIKTVVLTYKLSHGFNKSYQYSKNSFWAVK